MQLGSGIAGLWNRPADVAPIQPPAWELSYATGRALKRQKKKKIVHLTPKEFTFGYSLIYSFYEHLLSLVFAMQHFAIYWGNKAVLDFL